MDEFVDKKGGLPSGQDSEMFSGLCKSKNEEIEADLCTKFAELCGGNMSGMTAFVGGIASQEVLKYSGKFTPITQWAYFDCLELFPDVLGKYIYLYLLFVIF